MSSEGPGRVLNMTTGWRLDLIIRVVKELPPLWMRALSIVIAGFSMDRPNRKRNRER